MNASHLVRRLHRHRMWVNHRLLEAVLPLGEDQLRRPLPIGQGSVWRTLTHLMAAEHNWLEALRGNEASLFPGDAPGKPPGNQEGDGAVASLAELASMWRGAGSASRPPPAWTSHRSLNWPRCGETSTGGGTSTWRA